MTIMLSSFSKKNEIEKVVKELLAAGVIHPSTSPYSSLHDNSWQIFIHHHVLNKTTVNAKFPILMINELLDELIRACYFTKLDLCSSYHQVWMHIEDVKNTTLKHQGHYDF